MNTFKLKKKTRTKSELLNLEPERHAKLCDWLVNRVGLPKIKELIKDNFKIEVTIRQIEWFWKMAKKPIEKWQESIPANVPPLAWEAVRRYYERALNDPQSTPEQIKNALLFLRTGGTMNPNTAQTGHGKEEKKEPVEEVNPLDDDEKLRQVRIEVFGSAPD